MRNDESACVSTAASFVAAAANEVRLIKDESERGDCMYELASLQAMLGNVQDARATAAACPDSNRKSATYGYVAEIQTELGDLSGARSTLILAKEAALAGLSQQEKDRTYTYIESVAIKQAKLGDLQGAAETLALVENRDSRDLTQATLASFHTEPEAMVLISGISDPFKRDLAIGDLAQRKALSGDLYMEPLVYLPLCCYETIRGWTFQRNRSMDSVAHRRSRQDPGVARCCPSHRKSTLQWDEENHRTSGRWPTGYQAR